MPALCCALGSGKAVLVAKQIFFALSPSFFGPPRRSLQLKSNVLDPRLWNLVLWNYNSYFHISSLRALERNCEHVYLSHLVKNQGSFDANSKVVWSDWNRKLQTLWACAFYTKIILWWISDISHIYYKSMGECKYSDSTLSGLQYARTQRLSRHISLAVWQTPQVVHTLSTHPTPPIPPSGINPSYPSFFPF